MKNNKIIALFLILMLSIGACVKDNSNEKFNVLNEITIEGLETSYSPLIGDRLTITPIVKATRKNDLSYVWYLYSQMSNGKRDTLSTQESLDCVIGGSNAKPGIDYTLVYRVIDNQTGIFAYKHMKFTATSVYSKGALILCENESQVELAMMLPDGTVLGNLYPLNNDGETLNNKYREIESVDPKNSVTPEMAQVCIFADDENGGVVLDPTTLTKKSSVRDMFDDKIEDEIISVSSYTGKLGMIERILLNKKVCKRTTNMNTLLFQASPLVVSNTASDYSIGGYLCQGNIPVFYDDMNGRIVAHIPYNMGILIRANAELSSTTPFDADNMGQYDYVSGGALNLESDMWLLLRDKQNGELVMFKFKMEVPNPSEPSMTITPISKTVITSAIAPNIANAEHFILNNKKVTTNCMYVSNNKIYSVNVSMIGDNERMVELELAAPANMTITGCEYYSATVPAPTAEKPDATRVSEQIRLYVKDNSLSSKNGGVIYYEITTTGGLQAKEYLRKVGGFCDKIIDISEK